MFGKACVVIVLVLLCEHGDACSSMFGKEGVELPQGAERCSATEFYHEPSAQCYDFTYLEKQGPCGENMVLMAVHGSTKYIKCDCRKDGKAPYVYHKKTNQCYQLYTQGPCDRNKWIELEANKPKCAPNPCLGYHLQEDKDVTSDEIKVGVDANEPVVWFMGACTHLGRPCTLPPGAKLAFAKDPSGAVTATLRCLRSAPPGTVLSPFAIGALPAVSCPKNQYRSPDGKSCQEAMEFDFY